LKAVKLAVNLKKKEVEYYKKAAGKTKNPNGRKVFKYLAEEESRHLESIKKQLDSAEKKGGWLSDEKLFNKNVCRLERSRPKNIVPKEIKADANDLDALKEAIDIERKSLEVYTDIACKTDDKKALKILHYLIDTENIHLKELEIQYTFLKNEGFWYDNEVRVD